MFHIRHTIITLTNKRKVSYESGNSPPEEDYIRIAIVPVSTGLDIMRIIVTYRINDRYLTFHVPDNIVYSIPFHICDVDAGKTLVNTLAGIITKLEESEVETIAATLPEADVPEIHIRVFESFLIGLCSYLAFYILLSSHPAVWEELTCYFTLPGSPDNCLNRNMFRCLDAPLQALHRITNGSVQQLIYTVVNFINAWETYFDEGPHVDTNKTTLDILHYYAGLLIGNTFTIKDLGAQVKQLQDRVHKLEEKSYADFHDKVIGELNERVQATISTELSTLRENLETVVQDHIYKLGYNAILPALTPGLPGRITPEEKSMKTSCFPKLQDGNPAPLPPSKDMTSPSLTTATVKNPSSTRIPSGKPPLHILSHINNSSNNIKPDLGLPNFSFSPLSIIGDDNMKLKPLKPLVFPDSNGSGRQRVHRKVRTSQHR